MFDLPLHPKIVHLPLGLAIVLPFILIALVIFIAKQNASVRIWWIGVALAGVISFSSFVATKTGGDEWQHVEKIVPEHELEEHAEAGEWFRNVATGVFALALAAAFVSNDRARKALQWATIAASFLALLTGIRAGHEGGKVVYKYGGAAAYQKK